MDELFLVHPLLFLVPVIKHFPLKFFLMMVDFYYSFSAWNWNVHSLNKNNQQSKTRKLHFLQLI